MLLLGWNFVYEKGNTKIYWKTDPCLRELSGYYVAMEDVAEKYPPRHCAEKNLFMLPYNPQPENSNIWKTYLQKVMASLDEPVAHKEKTGYGKNGYRKSPALARLG